MLAQSVIASRSRRAPRQSDCEVRDTVTRHSGIFTKKLRSEKAISADSDGYGEFPKNLPGISRMRPGSPAKQPPREARQMPRSRSHCRQHLSRHQAKFWRSIYLQIHPYGAGQTVPGSCRRQTMDWTCRRQTSACATPAATLRVHPQGSKHQTKTPSPLSIQRSCRRCWHMRISATPASKKIKKVCWLSWPRSYTGRQSGSGGVPVRGDGLRRRMACSNGSQ